MTKSERDYIKFLIDGTKETYKQFIKDTQANEEEDDVINYLKVQLSRAFIFSLQNIQIFIDNLGGTTNDKDNKK